ncbi:hypothetical protein LCGC14_1123320 [marine sediment metagenome]|uniref:Uncharacterized protein n=1 Tax=marine sediment metagenome TaxID=412755 RepID=A0A0F9M3D4_9ZZZZ
MVELTSIGKEIRKLSKIGGRGFSQISISDVKIIKQKRELLRILRQNPDNILSIRLLYKGTILSNDRSIELGEISADDIDWKFTGQWTYGSKRYK